MKDSSSELGACCVSDHCLCRAKRLAGRRTNARLFGLLGVVAAALCLTPTLSLPHPASPSASVALTDPSPPSHPAAAQLRAGGGGFELRFSDGRVLGSRELVGAQLSTPQGMPLRVDAAQVVEVADQRLWLHTLSVRDATGQWHNLCTAHSDGSQWAMVIEGREQPDGTLQADKSQFFLTCSSGAQGKCLRFGYLPWRQDGSGNAAIDRFNACVRMVRGDYGGGGVGFTENGQRIDIYDDVGIQKPDNATDQTFEAGWSASGAVCVHHVRVARNTNLAALEERFPRLRGRTGSVCTEASARALGAIVFNRSAPTVQ